MSDEDDNFCDDTNGHDLDHPEAHRKQYKSSALHETLKTTAGIAGNILEWYDFAVFGFFSDILGLVFFPKDQPEDLSVMESFAVFGGAFLMRPIGGLVIGYTGDVSGRKRALEISIFLMAIATTLMGCLPTYKQIGGPAILLLLMVRMLQGLSVGGQLMSSLVFTLEGRPRNRWGLYGSYVMSAGNFGTFLGGIVAYGLRSSLSMEQLLRWGWRIPFLSGILISLCGIYLRFFCADDEMLAGHAPVSLPTDDVDDDRHQVVQSHAVQPPLAGAPLPESRVNPLRIAFSKENRRSLLASALVPILWSGGFYISFVWMAIYMQDLIIPPVPAAFGINSSSLLLLVFWFPLAGMLSDVVGRKRIMTIGGIVFGALGPIMILTIGHLGNGKSIWIAFCSQTALSIPLALWGAPMCAWLVEAFEPGARLTSVSIGYNVAQAIAGGMSPFVATLLVDKVGTGAPGLLLLALAVLSLTGLLYVAPKQPIEQAHRSLEEAELSLELKEMT